MAEEHIYTFPYEWADEPETAEVRASTDEDAYRALSRLLDDRHGIGVHVTSDEEIYAVAASPYSLWVGEPVVTRPAPPTGTPVALAAESAKLGPLADAINAALEAAGVHDPSAPDESITVRFDEAPSRLVLLVGGLERRAFGAADFADSDGEADRLALLTAVAGEVERFAEEARG